MDRWPRTPDDWRGAGSEPGHFGRRHEAGLYGDVEQDEAVGISLRRRRRPNLRSAVSHYPRQHGRSRFRRAGRRLEDRLSDRSGWPQRVVGTIDCRRTGAAPAVEHGLAPCETAVVAGWRKACVLALRAAGQLPRRRGTQHRRQLATACSRCPATSRCSGSDWSKDGQAILGACRFNRSERYSTCMVPLSSVNERGDSPVQVIASDSKRNLYNQRFSPDQRWITFLAHDLLRRLDVDGVRDTCRRWCRGER